VAGEFLGGWKIKKIPKKYLSCVLWFFWARLLSILRHISSEYYPISRYYSFQFFSNICKYRLLKCIKRAAMWFFKKCCIVVFFGSKRIAKYRYLHFWVFLKYQDIGKLSSTEHWVGSIFLFHFFQKTGTKIEVGENLWVKKNYISLFWKRQLRALLLGIVAAAYKVWSIVHK